MISLKIRYYFEYEMNLRNKKRFLNYYKML